MNIFFPWNQKMIYFTSLKRVLSRLPGGDQNTSSARSTLLQFDEFFHKSVIFLACFGVDNRSNTARVRITLHIILREIKSQYNFRSLKRVSEIAAKRSKFFFGTVNTPISSRCATPSRTHSMSIWWPNWWKAANSSTRSSSKSFFPKKKPNVSWRWSPPSSNPYILTGWVFTLSISVSRLLQQQKVKQKQIFSDASIWRVFFSICDFACARSRFGVGLDA